MDDDEVQRPPTTEEEAAPSFWASLTRWQQAAAVVLPLLLVVGAAVGTLAGGEEDTRGAAAVEVESPSLVDECRTKMAAIADHVANGGSSRDIMFEYGSEDAEAQFALEVGFQTKASAYTKGREAATQEAVKRIADECARLHS